MRNALLLILLTTLPATAQNRVVRREGAVLAHSLTFDPDTLSEAAPEALRELVRAYRTQPRYAERQQGTAVEPLLQSVRTQYSPFNDACPYYTYDDGSVSTGRCVSGCVATCIEQVVTYWRHPEALTDTLHGWETDHYTIPDVLPGTVIDWDNILYDYSSSYTEAQAQAVADLTYYCGVAAHMSWGVSSSGATLYRAFEPLWSAFDFQTIAFVQRALYSTPTWNRLLRNELEAGRPVCYTGHNMALSGHAFNIDGVDEDGYYHINWGYGGDYDGYFDLDYLNPFETASDATDIGQNEGFFCNQTALFMHPEDFVIDIFDTLSQDRALYGVTVDTVTFRRQPDTQGYTICDYTMTNTTADSLSYTFEVLTYEPNDTALFTNADYVAISAVNLAPGQTKTWPVYCAFTVSGDRIMAVTPGDSILTHTMPLTIAEGTEPVLTFGSVSHQMVHYGENLTADFSITVRNSASAGTAGNLVTFCLFETGSSVDQRHWYVMSTPAGGEETLTTTFQGLTDGQEYTLYVRCPWTVKATYTFTASMDEASDDMSDITVTESRDDRTYDLQGRLVSRPVRGLYIRGGKKILIR